MRIALTYILSLIASFVFAQDNACVCLPEILNVSSLEPINTKSLEFSPVYYGNGLVFVMAKERNKLFDPKTGQPYFDLMYADIGPDGSVTRPESFSSNIRTQYHEGPCTFSKSGNEIFFTRSDISANPEEKKKIKQDIQLKIYQGVKGPEDWENIKELPFSGNDYSIAHPTLSADEKRLVFSSNMPGGSGGWDLYVAERNGGEWMA